MFCAWSRPLVFCLPVEFDAGCFRNLCKRFGLRRLYEPSRTERSREERYVELVIAQPQRGHSEPEADAQVVPQLEHVLVQQLPRALPDTVPQAHVPPAAVVVEGEDPSAHLKAQDDCGNNGKLKNSSQTFSANSSQGGTSQKPYVGTMMSTSAITLRTTVMQMVISKVQAPM